MKKFQLFICLILCTFTTFAQFGRLKDVISGDESINFTEQQAVEAIKTTLENGVRKEVKKLTVKNGFLNNELAKIGFPENIKNVERKLRAVGLDNLVDKAVASLNHTAEEATKEAIPIFTDAITNIKVEDGINIIKGNESAATTYLKQKTYQQLYNKMSPIVSVKFKSVKADAIWSQLTTKYNRLPFTKDVNPDLIDYVTSQALEGVFKSIAKEELDIRNELSARTSDILRTVFGN
ncbi:DUF4197 domain-containing protein [Psychroflexus sp. ALD_RP9]|uniref:DUF4197 domain-containing protein n=1 Tax=Psychroflexus sp. ALD_RP9 TaxID=2777186 RepID=UPI001A8F5349|nr:DUF4197 domain-containing protein [Psychroflexus sp. ALD_RP9]QSS97591.1 DUF4197 domain-containing protein [Psychroflexus sp. ALD_RP9]